MTGSLQDLVARWVKHIGDVGETLEVGSYDVNGGVRQYLGDDYTGIDMREGPGVGLVMNARELARKFPAGFFKTVVWLETLEHDDCFWESMENIAAVHKQGGHLMVSAATLGMPKHDYPSDYWRFTAEGLWCLVGRYYSVLETGYSDGSVAVLAVRNPREVDIRFV